MGITKKELEDLYVELETPLYNFALRWVWNRAAAQDLVQEAFIRLWQWKGDVRHATIKSFLYKTIQNIALNEIRRNKLKESLPFVAWIIGPNTLSLESELIQKEDLKLLHLAIESLEVELKKTFLLCQYSDLSHDEIARVLDIPAGTVASRKNRALKQIQDIIKKDSRGVHG